MKRYANIGNVITSVIASLSVLLFVMFGSSSITNAAMIHEAPVKESYVINSFSGAVLGNASDVTLTHEALSFVFQGRLYRFALEVDTVAQNHDNHGAVIYHGEGEGLECILAVRDGKWSVTVFDDYQTSAMRVVDQSNNFILVGGLTSSDDIQSIGQFVGSVVTREEQGSYARSAAATCAGSLHVLRTSGTGGLSEGWAKGESIQSDVCRVYDLAYTIVQQTSADGISLWHDYWNGKKAYASPVSPPNGYQFVGKSWYIHATRGAFEASTTWLKIVNFIPIPIRLYDVSYMSGVHQ